MTQVATTQVKDEMIRVRVDSNLKQTTAKILKKLGMNYSEAINLFLSQVKLRKGLPFDVKIPNKKTLAAMKETENLENLAYYETPEDFFKEMEKW